MFFVSCSLLSLLRDWFSFFWLTVVKVTCLVLVYFITSLLLSLLLVQLSLLQAHCFLKYCSSCLSYKFTVVSVTWPFFLGTSSLMALILVKVPLLLNTAHCCLDTCPVFCTSSLASLLLDQFPITSSLLSVSIVHFFLFTSSLLFCLLVQLRGY